MLAHWCAHTPGWSTMLTLMRRSMRNVRLVVERVPSPASNAALLYFCRARGNSVQREQLKASAPGAPGAITAWTAAQ